MPDRPLPTRVARRLHSYQQQIDTIPDYAQRVAHAEIKFTARNCINSATFREVRSTLASMCSGAQRCGYCEESAAVEIDHLKPKTFYPETVFVWENYVYTCGGCNRIKGSNYAVFSASTGELIPVTRSAQSPLSPPEAGDSVLIDPRHEDPLEFMRIDLLGTFRFLPIGPPTSKRHQRARYTIDTLQLNTRPYLPISRQQAYQGYLSHLHRYIRWRDSEVYAARLDEPINAIRHEHHPTVWAEMKRQHLLITDLKLLFAEVPEALNW